MEKRLREDEDSLAPDSKRPHVQAASDVAPSAPVDVPESVQAMLAMRNAPGPAEGGGTPVDISKAIAAAQAAAAHATAPQGHSIQAPPAASAPAPNLATLAGSLPASVASQLPAILARLNADPSDATAALTAQLVTKALQAAQGGGVPPMAQAPPNAGVGTEYGRRPDYYSGSSEYDHGRDQGPYGGGGPGGPGGGGGGSSEEARSDIPCPVAHVGRVIGKGGEMIKSLQRSFGVRMQIDQKVPGAMERNVHILGTRQAVDLATQRVQAIIQSGIAEEEAGGMPSYITPNPHQQITNALACGDEFVGRVIGRGGENIRRTEGATGTKVQVSAKNPMGGPREVRISGMPHDVNRATVLVRALIAGDTIQDWNIPTILPGPDPNLGMGLHIGAPPIQRQMAATPYGMGGGVGGGAIGGAMGMARAKQVNGSFEEVLQCPRDKVGRVIGKGGENVRLMEMKSGGTDIQIDQKSMPPTAPCYVRITGNQTSVAYCKQLVEIIIEGGLAAVQQLPDIGSLGPEGLAPYIANMQATQRADTYYGGAGASIYQAPQNTSYYGSAGATAAPLAASASSSGWVEYKDNEGNAYYHNAATGVTQWEKPPGM